MLGLLWDPCTRRYAQVALLTPPKIIELGYQRDPQWATMTNPRRSRVKKQNVEDRLALIRYSNSPALC